MSLVAHYKLNDPSTLLVDATGNGNNLTNVGGVGVFTDPTYGPVASLNSSLSQRLQLGAAPPEIVGASPHTFSFWMKITSYSGTTVVYSQNTGAAYRLQIAPPDAITVLGQSNLSATLSDAEATQWRYYTVTYDGSTQKLYMQGVLINENVVALNRPAGNFQIGGGTKWPTGFGVYGLFTDFKIYDYALSASEVTSNYTDGPNVPVPTWVLNANSKYEISSRDHLIQCTPMRALCRPTSCPVLTFRRSTLTWRETALTLHP